MFPTGNCKFFHLPGASQCQDRALCHYTRGSSINSSRQWVHNPLPDKCVRALRGAVVSFDYGAEVCKVSPLDGWSAFRIDGFPEAFTCSDVLQFLDSLGNDLKQVNGAWIITMLAPNSLGKMRSARVTVENCDYANQVCNDLDTQNLYCHKFNAITEFMPTTALAQTLNDPSPIYKHACRVFEVGECVVCCDEAVIVMRTACGTLFCRSCWVQMCKEESKEKGFIACYGDDCTTKFSLQDLQTMNWLGPTGFESILENSLGVYLRQNPKAFIECPGAKCAQIYDREAHGAINCRRQNTCETPTFCTTCEDPHPGVMCEEYASDADGSKAGLEAYMKETNTKRCRHCWEAVQLREACNHISCRCGKHWCFRCRALFETAPECYSHMETVHGTTYGEVDVPPGERRPVPPAFIELGWNLGPVLHMDPAGWLNARGGLPEADPQVQPAQVLARGQLPPLEQPWVRQQGDAPLMWAGVGAERGIPPALELDRPPAQPRLAPRPAQEPRQQPELVEVARRREQARLTAARAEMQGHAAQAHAAVIRLQVDREDAFTRLEIRTAWTLRVEADDRAHRMQRAATLQEAEAILEGYRRQRAAIRRAVDRDRQRLNAVQANRPAHRQREGADGRAD